MIVITYCARANNCLLPRPTILAP